MTASYACDMNPPQNSSNSNLSGIVYVRLPFTIKAGLAGSPNLINNHEYHNAGVYIGAWHTNYKIFAYAGRSYVEMYDTSTTNPSTYSHSANSRLILNFTITYLSN